jgi:hypothetical protein
LFSIVDIINTFTVVVAVVVAAGCVFWVVVVVVGGGGGGGVVARCRSYSRVGCSLVCLFLCVCV